MNHSYDRHEFYGHTKAIDFLNQKPLFASVFLGASKDKEGKIIVTTLKVRYIENFLDQEFADFIKNYSPNHNQINTQLDHEGSLNFRFWECNSEKEFINLVKDMIKKKKIKLVAAAIYEFEKDSQREIAEKLWLEEDIVCFTSLDENHTISNDKEVKRAKSYAMNLARRYLKEDFFYDVCKVNYCETTRVIFPKFLTSLDAYKQINLGKDVEMLQKEAQEFKDNGAKMIYLSSTMQGGGVALMRHSCIRIFQELGLDCKWIVLLPDSKVFEITKKKFHNILHAIVPESIILHDGDKQIYNEWIERNYKILKDIILQANVIVIDDYQPSGLIPHIKRDHPKAKIVYRSHIQLRSDLIDMEGSSQKITWDFIWKDNQIKDVDLFISHPIPDFVPHPVQKEKVFLMPASTDPLDGLNKKLSDDQLDYYLHIFNLSLLMDNQKPLDLNRPVICQIARFDPAKGIVDVLHSFRELRRIYKHMKITSNLPQLVVCGHGAVDDPEGIPVLEIIKTIVDMGIFKEIADDIKILRLPHNDQILASIMQKSKIVLQLSHREGLEIKVTEALYQGKPVIIFNGTGIYLQVIDNSNSFIVELGDTKKVGGLLYQMFNDQSLYHQMSKSAHENINSQFFTIHNCLNWLRVANTLKGGKSIKELQKLQFTK